MTNHSEKSYLSTRQNRWDVLDQNYIVSMIYQVLESILSHITDPFNGHTKYYLKIYTYVFDLLPNLPYITIYISITIHLLTICICLNNWIILCYYYVIRFFNMHIQSKRPLSYFSFQPVLHDWCNKGYGMCYPVCGMVHIKEPLLLIGKSSLCGGSGFPFSLSEWFLTICLTPYNRR